VSYVTVMNGRILVRLLFSNVLANENVRFSEQVKCPVFEENRNSPGPYQSQRPDRTGPVKAERSEPQGSPLTGGRAGQS
jgi:hypothetical protein